MPDRLITTQSDFDALCDELSDAGLVAFDTEFVSESHYRPRLCLLQFATRSRLAVVDPFAVECLDRWWRMFVDDDTTIVTHGAREEVRFGLRYTAERPKRLVDVQVAEGLLSRGFPLSYKVLVRRVLNAQIDTHETRTDWAKRPLDSRQIDYSLEDVQHLLAIWDRQQRALQELERWDWAWDEFRRRTDVYAAEDDGERWRRVPGVHKLSRRELAVVRELYAWRDAQAQRRDRPARLVLRDDFLIDLARRKPRKLTDVTATRGMQRRDLKRDAPAILECVERSLAFGDEECPHQPAVRRVPPQEEVVAKLLAIALADRCAEFGLSQSIVGSMSDLHELVRWHAFHNRDGPTPQLLEGWRAEVCGNILTDLLDGRVTLRVADLRREAPLAFDPVE